MKWLESPFNCALAFGPLFHVTKERDGDTDVRKLISGKLRMHVTLSPSSRKIFSLECDFSLAMTLSPKLLFFQPFQTPALPEAKYAQGAAITELCRKRFNRGSERNELSVGGGCFSAEA